MAEGTAAPNDEIRCLSEVVDLQWPTISLLAQINQTREATELLGDFNRVIRARWKEIVAGGGELVDDGHGGVI